MLLLLVRRVRRTRRGVVDLGEGYAIVYDSCLLVVMVG